MKIGQPWKDRSSGAVALIERFEGDYVGVRFVDGGNTATIQRNTFLTCWEKRKLDVPTQERVRELIRTNGVTLPAEILERPFNILLIYPQSAGVGVDPKVVRRQVEQIAQREPWTIDIGNYQGGLDKRQAESILQACQQEGIPVGKRAWGSLLVHQILRNREAFPTEYRRLCEEFGTPEPAMLDG